MGNAEDDSRDENPDSVLYSSPSIVPLENEESGGGFGFDFSAVRSGVWLLVSIRFDDPPCKTTGFRGNDDYEVSPLQRS